MKRLALGVLVLSVLGCTVGAPEDVNTEVWRTEVTVTGDCPVPQVLQHPVMTRGPEPSVADGRGVFFNLFAPDEDGVSCVARDGQLDCLPEAAELGQHTVIWRLIGSGSDEDGIDATAALSSVGDTCSGALTWTARPLVRDTVRQPLAEDSCDGPPPTGADAGETHTFWFVNGTSTRLSVDRYDASGTPERIVSVDWAQFVELEARPGDWFGVNDQDREQACVGFFEAPGPGEVHVVGDGWGGG